MTVNRDRIKSYAKLVGKIPEALRMARRGASDTEQEEFDKEQVAPLHEQIGRERPAAPPASEED